MAVPGELLRSTLLKVGLPLLGIAILCLAAHRGRLTWKDDLGIARTPVGRAVLWIAAWVGWILLGEAARGVLGMPAPAPWPAYPPVIVAVRILAIGILGPILEELLFRGVLYHRLGRTRLGLTGAIVLIAAGWAALHTGQPWPEIGFTFLDGVVLGFARRHTGSIFAPCAMHACGNLYSIGQSLGLL